jgi:hypothetical protein
MRKTEAAETRAVRVLDVSQQSMVGGRDKLLTYELFQDQSDTEGAARDAELDPISLVISQLGATAGETTCTGGIGTGGSVWTAGLCLAKALEWMDYGARGGGSGSSFGGGGVMGDGRTMAGRAVLEIGSGPGLVGIVAGWLGADVLLTDVEDVLGLTRINVAANALPSAQESGGGGGDHGEGGVEAEGKEEGKGSGNAAATLDCGARRVRSRAAGGRMAVSEYYWGKEEDIDRIKAVYAASGTADGGTGSGTGGAKQCGGCGPDLIVASDVVYEPFHADLVLGTLETFLGSFPHTVAIVSYDTRGRVGIGRFLSGAKELFNVVAVKESEWHPETQGFAHFACVRITSKRRG